MTSKFRYLEEMKESGYHTDIIDDFHYQSMSYLANKFFQDKNSIIVDIGAGWGHCLVPLKKAGYKQLIAVDIDSVACSHLEIEGIRFHNVNLESEKLPLQDNSVDITISFFVIANLDDPSNFLSEVYRILREDGLLIMVTPDWRKQYKTFWRDHTHKHPYDKVSIARLLRCYQFNILDLKSFGVRRGLGRTNIWKLWNPLMFTGTNIIAVAKK